MGWLQCSGLHVLCWIVALGCVASVPPDEGDLKQLPARWLALPVAGQGALSLRHARFSPDSVVREARVGAERSLHLQVTGLPVRVQVPGYCAVEVRDLAEMPTLQPRLGLPNVLGQVGFGTRLTIDAQPLCGGDEVLGPIRWQQLAGPEVRLNPEQAGFKVNVHMPALPSELAQATAWGPLSVSAAQQGRVVLEARWQESEGEVLRHRIVLTAVARATGLPTIAVGQRVLLAGQGWTVLAQPRGPRAELSPVQALTAFTAFQRGRYRLRDAGGRELLLQAGRHDRVPLDCGRAPCHAEISRLARDSPMSRALAHLPLDGRGVSGGCVPDCHFSGEVGVEDGGFAHVATELGYAPLVAQNYAQLPVALQRLGGVRCTDCHGPAAIPPPQGRDAVVAAAVCATCHDQPPGLPQVQHWRASSMATADRLPMSRDNADCAACHTTAGFLTRLGLREAPPAASEAPSYGVACAVCHAPHGVHGQHLLRVLPTPASLPLAERVTAAAGLCAQCHAPLVEQKLPRASAAALLTGQARWPAPLGPGVWQGPAPHGALDGGCSACHGRPAGRRAGAAIDHTFGVEADRCRHCHDGGRVKRKPHAPVDVRHDPRRQAKFNARVAVLLQRLHERCGLPAPTDFPHHAGLGLEQVCADKALYRVQYLLGLLVADRASLAHNPRFAQQLFADALTTFERVSP